jgi:hypothetical protein
VERELRKRPGAKISVELPEILKALQDDRRWKDRKGLRHVYYDTKPLWERLEEMSQAQGWSLTDDGVSLSL